MREIPVDTSAVKFLGTGKAAGRARYDETGTNPDGSVRRERVKGQFERDDQGRTIYVVDVLVVDDGAERAEIASVKVPAWDLPATTLGQIVEFSGLVAIPWVNGNRVAMSYRATGIVDTANAPERKAS